MSAFVVSDKTICSVVDMLAKYEDVKNRSEIAKRLYLLNVESVNQRYQLKESDAESDRAEYAGYLKQAEVLEYFEQPERTLAQIHHAVHCWLYQSCEGDCMDKTLWRTVNRLSKLLAIDAAQEITGETVGDEDQAERIICAYKNNHRRDFDDIWD